MEHPSCSPALGWMPRRSPNQMNSELLTANTIAMSATNRPNGGLTDSTGRMTGAIRVTSHSIPSFPLSVPQSQQRYAIIEAHWSGQSASILGSSWVDGCCTLHFYFANVRSQLYQELLIRNDGLKTVELSEVLYRNI